MTDHHVIYRRSDYSLFMISMISLAKCEWILKMVKPKKKIVFWLTWPKKIFCLNFRPVWSFFVRFKKKIKHKRRAVERAFFLLDV